MNLYEQIKELASKKRVSIRQIEEKLNFSNGTIRQWNKSKPSIEKVQAVANYFNISIDKLLGDDSATKQPIDLADLVDDSKVNWDDWVSFDGKPLTDEVKTAMKLILGKRLED